MFLCNEVPFIIDDKCVNSTRSQGLNMGKANFEIVRKERSNGCTNPILYISCGQKYHSDKFLKERYRRSRVVLSSASDLSDTLHRSYPNVIMYEPVLQKKPYWPTIHLQPKKGFFSLTKHVFVYTSNWCRALIPSSQRYRKYSFALGAGGLRPSILWPLVVKNAFIRWMDSPAYYAHVCHPNPSTFN